MATLTKEELLEAIDDMPKALYSGGFYLRYDMNGLWYCGYNNTVFHASNRDLSIAIDELRIKLKVSRYAR
jgi:hypothetical protein